MLVGSAKEWLFARIMIAVGVRQYVGYLRLIEIMKEESSNYTMEDIKGVIDHCIEKGYLISLHECTICPPTDPDTGERILDPIGLNWLRP